MGSNWIAKFLSFDELIGAELTRVTYLAGLVVILGWAILRILGALTQLFESFFMAVGTIIAAPLQAGFAILIWRLLAEAAFVFFRAHDEIVVPAASQDTTFTEGFAVDAEEAGAEQKP